MRKKKKAYLTGKLTRKTDTANFNARSTDFKALYGSKIV